MYKKIQVTIFPEGVSAEVAKGTLLSDVIRILFPDTDFPCGGKGLCEKCQCLLDLPSGDEAVLACQFVVCEDIRMIAQFPVWKHDVDISVSESVEKHKQSSLGVAVDVGTTTLVFSILDLDTGEDLVTVETTNPQTAFGTDVMSRIAFCQERTEGSEILQRALFLKLDRLLVKAIDDAGLDRDRISRVVMAGNTCMEHIICGVSPIGLGMAPYQPSFVGSRRLDPSRVPLCSIPKVPIVVAPVIGGFVGGDIAVGILSTQLQRQSGPTVFVDVGTNGEIIVANNGKMVGASSAAGPAFEGAGISCGHRAAPGAIYSIVLQTSSLIETIQGKQPPTGLCGSGVLSAVAELVRNGMVDISGRLRAAEEWPVSVPKDLYVLLREEGGERRFYFTKEVFLSQSDIRQIQLAKSAIRSNLDLLLASLGLVPGKVEKIFLGGAFGLHIDLEGAFTLGMFPQEFRGKVRQVGNTSLAGAKLLTLYPHLLRDLEKECRSIEIVNLAGDPEFQDIFIKNLLFTTFSKRM